MAMAQAARREGAAASRAARVRSAAVRAAGAKATATRPGQDPAGMGRVLVETGWAASPEFLDLPLVPGSGREIPPWVWPARYWPGSRPSWARSNGATEEEEAFLRHPRGCILWPRYLAESMVRGQWERLPCRFPDLGQDPKLRRCARWVLERVRTDLVAVGGTEPVATSLAAAAVRLIKLLADVLPLAPSRDDLRRSLGWRGQGLVDEAVRRGIEAFAWVVEERGLGGGRELDGLA